MKILIKGGQLINPVAGTEAPADIYIAAGRIVGVAMYAADAPTDFHAEKTIDATGLIVVPGLIDLSARLREPGRGYRATLESEMTAALAGGVTSLVCPPDTEPVLDEPGLVEMLKFRARNLRQAHLYPLGALTVGLQGKTLTSMVELTEAGCIGFSQADKPIAKTRVLMRALQYAATYDYPVWLRPQEASLAQGGVAASGIVASRLGLAGVPVIAETIALDTIFELMRATGARVHLSHLSSAAGIERVRAAKREGLRLSCDVTINHLHLIDADIDYFNPHCRLDPPLRTQRDRDAIRTALLDGTIDAICSDHTPVNDDEKLLPFDEASPGAIGLELLLPLVVKWAGEAGLPLARALAKVTSAPADIIALPAGCLVPGAPADLALFDPAQYWRVTPHLLKSQGHNTPLLGSELPASVLMTLADGQMVFERPVSQNLFSNSGMCLNLRVESNCR